MQSALIIRPDGKCQKTVEAFLKQGIKAFGLPLISVKAIEPVCYDVRHQLTSANGPDIVIFTSTYAAKFVIKAMQQQDWPETTNIIAIGEGTASTLITAGITVRTPDVASSEGLLNMNDLLDVSGMHIAIIKGVGGRTLLKQRLSQLGASVTNFDCYERLPNLAVIEQLGQNEAKAECVVATSGELIELALMHLDDAWRLKTWVVVSERTAEIAREKGIEDVVVSPSARNEDLYTTCQKL